MPKKIGKLAKRYAQALLAAAIQQLGNNGEPTPAQQLAGELAAFCALWGDERDYLLNPMFSRAERLLEKFFLSSLDKPRSQYK